jgi:exonuclease III
MPVSLPDSGLHVWAAHIPGWTDGPVAGQAKTRFWDALLGIAMTSAHPTLLVGDFNTGRHRIDETGKTFNLADRFEQLTEKWTDAWRHIHGDKREFTWFSRSGNGFRIDHAFVTASLSDRLERAEYSQVEREQGVSDHSPLIVDLRDVRRGPIAVGDF